ncbi:QsdR family transcriptional regulator [Nocardioides insulae]|uniref:QsdR family transcriptional regulator n=1 Tax=Nocardioides insulae TaxID=394734 RepID=UPI000413C05F|nr:QsdR family transcriptional regulator [Nocardioides insulae]
MSAAPAASRAETIIAAASRWVVRGQRLDMQGLADEIGVSRATLFRHVGGREDLLAEALWMLTESMLKIAEKRWEGERRPDQFHYFGTGHYINEMIAKSPGVRRLLNEEPTLTLRLVTDPHGRIQPGVTSFVEQLVRRDMEEFGLRPAIDPGDLAYALVRLGESFLYADVLADRHPDLATADRVQRALFEALLT